MVVNKLHAQIRRRVSLEQETCRETVCPATCVGMQAAQRSQIVNLVALPSLVRIQPGAQFLTEHLIAG